MEKPNFGKKHPSKEGSLLGGTFNKNPMIKSSTPNTLLVSAPESQTPR